MEANISDICDVLLDPLRRLGFDNNVETSDTN
jgi:hypothetical protein